MTLPTIWQNDAFRTFLREAGYTNLQWNDGLKDYLVFILSASPTLTLNDLLNLYYNTFGTWEIQFTPDDLFILGQYGFWWDATSTNYITQDSLGTISVTGATDPVGLLIDRSGNSVDGIQATTSLKPLYQINPSRVVFDVVDDYISVSILSTVVGTLLVATDKGIVHCDVNIPIGTWNIPTSTIGFHGDNFTGIILRDGYLSSSELTFTKNYLSTTTQYTPIGTDLAKAFLNRSDITRIYLEDWDVSNITTLANFTDSCSNLTSIDISNWYTPLLTDINYLCYNCTNLSLVKLGNHNLINCFAAFQNCTSLINLDISKSSTINTTAFGYFCSNCINLENINLGNAFSDSPCIDYNYAFRECALNQEVVDNILVNINKSGTSGGILHINLGTNSTPSIIGQNATDSLRSRGWLVFLNGY